MGSSEWAESHREAAEDTGGGPDRPVSSSMDDPDIASCSAGMPMEEPAADDWWRDLELALDEDEPQPEPGDFWNDEESSDDWQ